MAIKAIFVFCALALMVQSAYSACFGGLGAPAYGYGLAGAGCGYNGFAGFGCGCGGVASTGGGLPCASASPIPPVGVSVLSENVYEGFLAAGGNLPFLGTVGFEGVLPTAGAGAVSYGCGSSVGIVAEEGAAATGIAPHVPGYPFGGYGGAYGAYGAYGPAAGYGLGGCGYGLGGCGYGLGGYGYGAYGAGCGCGGIY